MRHDITCTVPDLQLGNADWSLKIKTDGVVLDTLKLSRGGVVWVPKNRTNGYSLNWHEFGDLLENNNRTDHGHPARATKQSW